MNLLWFRVKFLAVGVCFMQPSAVYAYATSVIGLLKFWSVKSRMLVGSPDGPDCKRNMCFLGSHLLAT